MLAAAIMPDRASDMLTTANSYFSDYELDMSRVSFISLREKERKKDRREKTCLRRKFSYVKIFSFSDKRGEILNDIFLRIFNVAGFNVR